MLSVPAENQTLRSLYIEHGKSISPIYWCTLAAALIFIISLPLISVEVTVRAPGLIRPSSERTEIRAPLSGEIEKVFVTENSFVQRAQPLLTFRSRDLEERTALNLTRKAATQLLVADLVTVLAEDTLHMNSPAFVSRPVNTPNNRTSNDQITAVGAEVHSGEIRSDVSHVAAQIASQELAVARFARELKRSRSLAERGLITEREYDQAKDDLAAAESELLTLKRTTQNRWESRLQEERNTLSGLVTEAGRLAEEATQMVVRAPVKGTVQGFSGLFAGGWLPAGGNIGAISPEDSLVVETYVSPRDIGLIRDDQTARIQIDAFPYTQWGMLSGRVLAIAQDATSTGSNNGSNNVFKVAVSPSANLLRLQNGAVGHLRKGMTLTARFIVARRSVFQLLYDDVSSWLDPRATEDRS